MISDSAHPAALELTMSQQDNSVPQFSSCEIERQARIKRSVVIQALARGTMRAFAKWLRSLVLRSTQLTRRLAARRRTYSDIRELQRFDDRMLPNISIATDRRAQFDGQIAAVNAQVLSRASLSRLSHFDFWAQRASAWRWPAQRWRKARPLCLQSVRKPTSGSSH